MIKVIPTDIYDDTGNLLRIEFHDFDGVFQLQAEWDANDAQTSKNRESFRKWAYTMAKRLEFKPEL